MISYHEMSEMSRDDKKIFRITAWPGVLLPHPAVPHRGWRLEGERLIASRSSPGGGGGIGAREQVLEVEEVYLELLHVDVERAEEIVDFATVSTSWESGRQQTPPHDPSPSCRSS